MSRFQQLIKKKFEDKIVEFFTKVGEDEFPYFPHEMVIVSFTDNSVKHEIILQYNTNKNLFTIKEDRIKLLEIYNDGGCFDYLVMIVMIYVENFMKNYKTRCMCCHNPFGFVYSCEIETFDTTKSSFISNYCKMCEEKYTTKLFCTSIREKYNLEEIGCDICYNKCISFVEDEEDMIIFNPMKKLTCCNDKHICKTCLEKIGSCKCPFCRQQREEENII